MPEIIVEGVLFVALLAAVAALLYFILLYLTPAGLRYRQAQNRKRLDRAAEMVCPIHGPRREEELVRLSNGDVLCPDCYKEMLHD